MQLHYRRPKTSLFGDFEQQAEQQAATRVESPAAAQTRDWTSARKARSFDVLMPTTRRWAESLPDSTSARTLLQTYPRIANRVAKAWRDERESLAVLDDLLVDRRGGRRGFSPSVQGELLGLRTLRDGAHSRYSGPFSGTALRED